MRLLLSTLAAGAFSLALPVIAAQAAPLRDMPQPGTAQAPVVKADWDGYHHDWHHHWHHDEWRGDYAPYWHHRHWHRPPPYGYYAPPPPPGYVYGYRYGY